MSRLNYAKYANFLLRIEQFKTLQISLQWLVETNFSTPIGTHYYSKISILNLLPIL